MKYMALNIVSLAENNAISLCPIDDVEFNYDETAMIEWAILLENNLISVFLYVIHVTYILLMQIVVIEYLHK